MLSVVAAAFALAPPLNDRVGRRDVLQRATATAAGSLLPLTAAPLPSAAASPKEKLILPKLGLGAWAWGDRLFWGYNEKQDADLSDVFDYALSKGVTFFDTAELYGPGRSEELLGQFAARSPQSDQIQVT